MKKFSSRLSLSLVAMALAVTLTACEHREKDSPESSPNSLDQKVSKGSTETDKTAIEEATVAYMGIKPDEISDTPIPGLKQLVMQGNIMYASADGKYLVQANIMDVLARKSITDEAAQKAMGYLNEKRAPILKERLDMSEAITYKAAKEVDELYVFTDSTCAYCAKFHESIPEYNRLGLTIHYFPWPRTGKSGEAYDLLTTVWCSADKKKALDAEFAKKPIKPISCDNKLVDKYVDLGIELNVNGTPAVFLKNGANLGGAVPPSEIMAAINKAKGSSAAK